MAKAGVLAPRLHPLCTKDQFEGCCACELNVNIALYQTFIPARDRCLCMRLLR